MPHHEGKLPGKFSTLLHVSEFVCLWILILWKRSTAFEDQNKAGVAEPSFRISSLALVLCTRLPTRSHHRLLGKCRIFACLMQHLLVIVKETVQLFCSNAKKSWLGFMQASAGFWQEFISLVLLLFSNCICLVVLVYLSSGSRDNQLAWLSAKLKNNLPTGRNKILNVNYWALDSRQVDVALP